MLASRMLPPIIPRSPRSPPSPPVATFINIPRRYVKSNMQVGHEGSDTNMEDAKSLRHDQKSSKFNELHSATTSSPTHRRSKELQDRTFAPSPARATKGKRAAPLDEYDLEEDAIDSKTQRSSSSADSAELSGHVCLCQPEPKIPRPRNAFILYRQHHQQTIVARNPGLSNPEISKIIGDQWRAESESQKRVWQDLAQREKEKHQEQYPDYRYQPRRLGKPTSLSVNTSGQHTAADKYRCPRCGGRSIKTPTTPFLPTPTPTLPPPNSSNNLTPTTRYLPVMSNLSLESPVYRRRAPGPSYLGNVQVSSAHGEAGLYSPSTPDAKRRRYNYPTSINGRRVEGAYYGHSRRGSLPPISQMRPSTPVTATMSSPRTPRETRRASVADLNVLVPNQHDQSRSVEAMVMSVPYDVKIKVLGRITPPLKDPGPTSPAIAIRGAIIAVEGEDMSAVEDLAQWLKEYLEKEKEYVPRIAQPPKGPEEQSKDVTFEAYLDLIKEWHGKSKEMIEFITTPITPPESDGENDEKDSKSSDSKVASKPVVILPTYQLHASDVYTSKIPIQDAYSPTDHWQWMATLWRGTVGPDLTIYVKNGDDKDGSPNGKPVALSEDTRCLTVRKDKSGKFEDSALRRVGFEVGEWIRSVGSSA